VRYKVTLPRIELTEPTNIDRPNQQLHYNTNSLFVCLNIFIGQIIEIKEEEKREYKMQFVRIEQRTRIIDRCT